MSNLAPEAKLCGNPEPDCLPPIESTDLLFYLDKLLHATTV